MLKKTELFKWTSEADKSYKTLKAILASAPVLLAADFSKDFFLFTDASNIAVSAVLTQKDNNDIYRPISYLSHKLNKAQRNYSTIEKELLAIVLAVRTYRIYLSKPTVVFSDHQPLVYMHKLTSVNNRLLRWSLELAPYDLKVTYLKGVRNCLADFLSRPSSEQVALDSSTPSSIQDVATSSASASSISSTTFVESACVLSISRFVGIGLRHYRRQSVYVTTIIECVIVE